MLGYFRQWTTSKNTSLSSQVSRDVCQKGTRGMFVISLYHWQKSQEGFPTQKSKLGRLEVAQVRNIKSMLRTSTFTYRPLSGLIKNSAPNIISPFHLSLHWSSGKI